MPLAIIPTPMVDDERRVPQLSGCVHSSLRYLFIGFLRQGVQGGYATQGSLIPPRPLLPKDSEASLKGSLGTYPP